MVVLGRCYALIRKHPDIRRNNEEKEVGKMSRNLALAHNSMRAYSAVMVDLCWRVGRAS